MKVSEGMRGRILLVWQNIDSPFLQMKKRVKQSAMCLI